MPGSEFRDSIAIGSSPAPAEVISVSSRRGRSASQAGVSAKEEGRQHDGDDESLEEDVSQVEVLPAAPGRIEQKRRHCAHERPDEAVKEVMAQKVDPEEHDARHDAVEGRVAAHDAKAGKEARCCSRVTTGEGLVGLLRKEKVERLGGFPASGEVQQIISE